MKIVENILFRILFWFLLTLPLLQLVGCANMPTSYGDNVEITSGVHKGKRGKLVGNCGWFENYMIRLFNDTIICARPWQMEKI